MKIKLKENIEIEAEDSVIKVIQKSCTHKNPKYDEALRLGYSVRKIDRYIQLSNQIESGLNIPIGLLADLLIQYPNAEVIDQRQTVKTHIPFTGTLRPYQQLFIDQAIEIESGVMVAATGAGKTVSGIALASKLKQRTLILVKSKDLAEQWRGAIKQFTGLESGLIGGGKNTEGEQFTIGLTQTLFKRDLSQLDYGLVIADECHNAPASQFYKVINSLNSRYKFGLSATPQRRDNLEFMIFSALGAICSEIKVDQLQGKVLPVEVNVIEHDFYEPMLFDSWNNYIEVISHDESRNRLIIDEAEMYCCINLQPTIILCSTVNHCELLSELADYEGLEPLLIHGQLSSKVRAERMRRAPESNLIIGTSQLLSEGIDLPHLEVLIFATPMSAVIDKENPTATKLIQSIGRCRRPYPGKEHAIVIDIVDRCGFGISTYKKRKHIYDLQGFKVAA